MGARYRRSIALGGGLRLTVSGGGLSLSAGVPGLRHTWSTSGRRTTTVGLPGTGLSYRRSTGAHPPSRTARPTRAAYPAPPARPAARPPAAAQHPGLFAPAGYRALADGVAGALAGQPVPTWSAHCAAAAHASAALAPVAWALTGILGAGQQQQPGPPGPEQGEDLVGRCLRSAWDSGVEVGADPFVTRYAAHVVVHARIGALTADLGVSRATVGMLLALHTEAAGDDPGALAVASALPPSRWQQLLVAELALDTGDPARAIAATDGTVNDSDLGALLLTTRAAALRAAGEAGAGLAAAREALTSRARDAAVLRAARVERGWCYLATGQRGRARADADAVLAADAATPGLDRLRAALDSP